MEPKTRIETEYLMTVYVPLERPQKVNSFDIYNAKPGGWVAGPHIKGEVVGPAADWLRNLPGGVKALDVRLSILADDGSYVFMQYGGRIVGKDRLQKWPMPPEASSYFVINPTFETSSEKYSWLNDLVCVGRYVGPEDGDDDHVLYEVFRVI